MISYLSLKRKKPVSETTMLNVEIIPNQLVCLFPYLYAASKFKPKVLINGCFKVNSSVANKVINKTASEPTATITNIFCLSFILQFNTVTTILVVTQVL